MAGDAFDMCNKANATCIALEARVVQPLLLWKPYTLIDSLGHTDLFVSLLFAAICPSYASASIVLLSHHLIRIDTNLYLRLPLVLIARPHIIPVSSESDTVGRAAELIGSDLVSGAICDASV